MLTTHQSHKLWYIMAWANAREIVVHLMHFEEADGTSLLT